METQTPLSKPAPTVPLFTVLKWAGIAAAIILIGFKCYDAYNFYTVRAPQNNYTQIVIAYYNVFFAADVILLLIAILIFLRSKTSAAFYIAIFLVVYQSTFVLPKPTSLATYLLGAIVSIVAGILIIFSFQHFPIKLTTQHIDRAIKYKWLRRFLKTFLRPRTLWLGFSGILLLIAIIEYWLPGLQNLFTNLLIMGMATVYLFVSYSNTKGIENSRIIWLFWGILMYILLFLTLEAVYMYAGGVHKTASYIIGMISQAVLIASFGMSLFFADTFNTGKIFTRTLVNGILFVLVIVIYNTLEHYVLHWLSHTLHISNIMLSSLLSGVIVLFISPLHHRLTHYLNRKLQKKHGHAPIDYSPGEQKKALD